MNYPQTNTTEMDSLATVTGKQPTKNRVLLIEDNPGDARLVEILLSESDLLDCEIINRVTLAEGMAELENEEEFAAILLDLTLPDSRGFETLERLITKYPNNNVIVLTGLADKSLGLKAVMAGAQDFLVKGQLDGKLLGRTIRYSLQRFKTQLKLQETAKELEINKKRYVEAQEMAHFGNWEMDIVSNSMKWTDEVYRIFGYKPGSINPTFSDYMKNAIRLSALMNLPVVYQFTHDSILLGEYGPTHQPIEHLASLRSIPNLTVIRPADNTEVKGAWVQALESKNPTALVLSRQGLANCEGTSAEAVSKGAYIVKEASNNSAIDLSILATGSELALALDVANELESNGDSVRVISMASFELFDKQSKDYQNTVLSKQSKTFMVIEAQTSFGWHKYVGRDAICITVEDFGLSAPAADLKEQYGFTKEAVIKRYK